ncbi:MAG: hypothetical protein JWL62_3368 [Hyphomicrobiales bacterium]|nr:hypothetical protein [Hyphomicrobiales bacterium]
MPQTILIAQDARGCVTVTLDRPERGNAFDQTMLDELGAVFEASAADPSVRLLVLRAAGRHFCTGADMKSRGEAGQGGLTFNGVLARLDSFPKPTIAIVEGGCLGGGLGLAACCDLVLATEAAYFGIPELRVGIAPSPELTGLLARAMGQRALRRYGLTGERLQALDALRIGLVHELVSTDAIGSRLAEIADAILHNAPGATAEMKATIGALSTPRRDVLFPPGGPARRGLERSPEALEGVAAFREKRQPAWYPPKDAKD